MRVKCKVSLENNERILRFSINEVEQRQMVLSEEQYWSWSLAWQSRNVCWASASGRCRNQWTPVFAAMNEARRKQSLKRLAKTESWSSLLRNSSKLRRQRKPLGHSSMTKSKSCDYTMKWQMSEGPDLANEISESMVKFTWRYAESDDQSHPEKKCVEAK